MRRPEVASTRGDATENAPMRVHGGIDPAELAALGVDARDVLDCSVSVNPYGPTPAVSEAIRAAALERYPDATAAAARGALARLAGTSPARVVVGNGAADLLWSLARVLVRPGAPVLVPEPTFAEFPAAATTVGGRVVAARRPEQAVDVPDLGVIDGLVRDHRPDVVYLCAPNNPTGEALRAAAIASLAACHPDVWFVVDEAFLSLSEYWRDATEPLPDNAIRVRSLTKEHAIPGVRVGYALATEAVAARVEAARPAWTTSAMAQAAAVAACGTDDFVATSRTRLLAECRQLRDDLAVLGVAPRPTSTFFFLVPVPDAATIRRRLLTRHRILVRDCSSFGLPACVRIAARRPEENARIRAALAAELAGRA